jgi:hypothetical protein
MASHIPEVSVSRVEPQGDDSVSPSFDRIKHLALEKRKNYLTESAPTKKKPNREGEKPMKKKLIMSILVAAMLLTMCLTAFAAGGGLDYLKSIFGDSIESIQNETVTTPLVTASANGRDMALEAMVTDGYVTYMIVSLTGEQPTLEAWDLFAVTTDLDIKLYSWDVLEEFTVSTKSFYVVYLVSEERFDAGEITLSLNRDIAPIDLSFQIENKLGNTVITFPENTISGSAQLIELQVSPMSFLLICNEENPLRAPHPISIRLVFSDGKTEDLFTEAYLSHSDFSDIDLSETAMLYGHHMFITIEDGPLAKALSIMKNPDGELVYDGLFSRIINPASIEKVIIDGKEYSVK